MKPKPFEKSYSISAPRTRVFAAFADESQLRVWFAEHTRIDPRVGGAYKFWGRSTFLVPDESHANQAITHFDPPAALGYSWRWAGAEGRVELEFAESSGKTMLRVHHEMDADVPGFEGDTIYFMSDLWGTAIGNLRSFVATGKPALLPDYSAAPGPVKLSVEIDASPSDVMSALTDPAQMNQWIARAAKVDLRPGGDYSYGWTMKRDGKDVPAGPFKVVEYIPDRLLVHDWEYHQEGLTRVRWELEELPRDRTRVTLTHERFDEPKRWGGYVQGWANFLLELKVFSQEN